MLLPLGGSSVTMVTCTQDTALLMLQKSIVVQNLVVALRVCDAFSNVV